MNDLSTYRAYQVTGQRHFELVDRELVAPSAGHVRFRVHSCGVCHSDTLGVEGQRAEPSQPVVPGHEVVGVIDAVGDGVTTWHVGERVGAVDLRLALAEEVQVGAVEDHDRGVGQGAGHGSSGPFGHVVRGGAAGRRPLLGPGLSRPLRTTARPRNRCSLWVVDAACTMYAP